MAKSFANRFLLMGLFSLLVFGNMSSAMAAAMTMCGTNGVYLGNNFYACPSESTKTGCNRYVTYTIYNSGSSAALGKATSCENSTRTGHACEVDAMHNWFTQTNTYTYGTSSIDMQVWGCCVKGAVREQTLSISRGKRITSYNPISVVGGTGTAVDVCGTARINQQYECECNTGFKVQSQGSSSCNCDAYASGYSCYVASCTGNQQGVSSQYVGNHYISDDRKSCTACPTGTESTILAANKIYYSGGTGPMVWTGRVGEQINNSAFAKIGIASCYQPVGTAMAPNEFQDGNGNAFTLSQSCHYTE